MKRRGWKELSSIYIGTVIGAGFASGKEIIQFFSIFGYKGLFGLFLASTLFSIVGAVVLHRVYTYKIKNYEELITPIFGVRISRIIDIIVTLFLLIGFCVMLAGSGAIFKQEFNFSFNIGIYIMSIASLLTFMFSVKGVSVINTLLVPLLLIGITLIGLIVVFKEGLIFSNYQGTEITRTGNWVTSAVLYVSYNSICVIVIMSSLLSIIPSKKAAIKGGIMGGLGLGILASFILLTTLIFYSDIYKLEIPMIGIACKLGRWASYSYAVILWCSMFTTAISSGFGCIIRLTYIFKTNQKLIAFLFCFATMPLAKIGFTKLVSVFYPIFGYVGFLMLLFIIGNIVIKQGNKL